MPKQAIGISILTNADRLGSLQECLHSFFSYCHYRPLIIGIFDNGSTDATAEFIKSYVAPYGVTLRSKRSDVDLGCAKGTNKAMELVDDCKYAIHLESDFIHLPSKVSGVDTLWLHKAVSLLESGDCDYLYLRRMRGPHEMVMHWWSQWMPLVTEEHGEYLKCPRFWWSNNPTLRRTQALLDCGTLPLSEHTDGAKGTPGWSMPELQAARPTKAWIHKWGMFVHDPPVGEIVSYGNCMHGTSCGKMLGTTGCKYGFFIKDIDNPWCSVCAKAESFQDMQEHEKRWRNNI